MLKAKSKRIERDALGEIAVPEDALYGVQTLRAVENFPISGIRAHRSFIKATAAVKLCAARVHLELGLLEEKKADAIIHASKEVFSGKLDDQFVVDVYQAGAGTSHNMNANEVIANRAIELLGGRKGDYSIIHPNDDVNKSQSTNDVFPTAMRLAAVEAAGELAAVLEGLYKKITDKAGEFGDVVKSGRTHLQDAVPIRLGQEFKAYATSVGRHAEQIKDAGNKLKVLGIGGSAVGTGINTHPLYAKKMVRELSRLTGIKFSLSDDLFESMQSMAPFVSLSSSLKNLSLDLIRIANDLRLMSSGPRTGLAEIELPALQPGSSIMPGKVNPVMAEALNMVCFQVVGNDTAISLASQAGQLELNVMMPVISYNLLQSIHILTNALTAFANRCVEGIKANIENCRHWAERSLSIVTALNPRIGYAKAAEIAKEAFRRGVTVRDIIIEKGVLTEKELEKLLDLESLTRVGLH